MPRHPGNNGASATSTADGIARGIEKRDSSSKRPVSWHIDSRKNSTDLSPIDSNKKSIFSTLLAKSVSNPTTPTKNSKLKYPVSGLSTNQIVKANRKTISRHKHPETKVQTKINRSQSTGGTTSSKDVSY